MPEPYPVVYVAVHPSEIVGNPQALQNAWEGTLQRVEQRGGGEREDIAAIVMAVPLRFVAAWQAALATLLEDEPAPTFEGSLEASD